MANNGKISNLPRIIAADMRSLLEGAIAIISSAEAGPLADSTALFVIAEHE